MASDEPLPIGCRLGDFEIVGLLPDGYRARDRDAGRDVAIEALPVDADAVRRFQRGVAELSNLNHPNIAAIHDLVIHDDRAYLIRELVEGEPLWERLVARPLSIDESVSLVSQLVDAIGAAHESGLVHGNLNATNVIVGDEGEAKIVGFGLGSDANASDDVRAIERLIHEMLPSESDALPEELRRLLEPRRVTGVRRRWPLPRVARWVFVILAVVLIVTAYITLRTGLPP